MPCVPFDSIWFERYIERRLADYNLDEFQIQINHSMAKLYESDSKADGTLIEGNLSEKLTFVRRGILCDFMSKQFHELKDFFSYFICFVVGK